MAMVPLKTQVYFAHHRFYTRLNVRLRSSEVRRSGSAYLGVHPELALVGASLVVVDEATEALPSLTKALRRL